MLNLHEISGAKLAKELGIVRQNVNLWLSGKQRIPKKHLEYLSNRFNIPSEYFDKEELDILEIAECKKAFVAKQNFTFKTAYIKDIEEEANQQILINSISEKIRENNLTKDYFMYMNACFENQNSFQTKILRLILELIRKDENNYQRLSEFYQDIKFKYDYYKLQDKAILTQYKRNIEEAEYSLYKIKETLFDIGKITIIESIINDLENLITGEDTIG